ncbi:MAG: hypothetical protein A2498_14260 [Lentisphaerae bacterium RIFOXYC12_FULL_60_16]|nr:MAG: hypothetical protein A2498_14260 [Lentisphaerae bacterium RIFOXYC12_FULL_60_16]
MPEASKEQLSPEEKLLKVIQTGGQVETPSSPEEKLAKAVAAPAAPRPAPAVVPVAPAAPQPTPAAPAAPVQPAARPAVSIKPSLVVKSAKPEAPKLKLNRPPAQEKERAAKAAAFAKSMGTLPPDTAGSGGGDTVAPAAPGAVVSGAPVTRGTVRRTTVAGRAPSRAKFGERPAMLTLANRSLVAVILLTVGLCGYEVWAAMRWDANFGKMGAGSEAVSTLPALDIPPDIYLLQDVMDQYARRPLIGLFVVPDKGSTPPPPDPRIEATDTGRYISENLQMIGHSTDSAGGMEAIVMDKLDNRMHVLVVGNLMPIKDKVVTVTEILPDRVVVKDGAVSLVIK